MLVIGGFGHNSKVEIFQSVSFKNGNALQRGEPCGSQSSLQRGHGWPLCPQQGIFLRREPLPFLALVELKWPEPLTLSPVPQPWPLWPRETQSWWLPLPPATSPACGSSARGMTPRQPRRSHCGLIR